MSILPRVDDPDRMTWRAQAYLLLNFLVFAGMGWFCIAHADQFAATAYIPIVELLDIRWWGVLFLSGGIVCGVGALARSPSWARIGLVLTAAVLGACAAGLWIGIIAVWLSGKPATPISTMIMTFVVVANLLMCRQPLRTLFEQVVVRAFKD